MSDQNKSPNPTPTPSQENRHYDVYNYVGGINMLGYHKLCACLREKKHERAMLVLTTPGGDPHAAFRIARALQHEYPEHGFSALIPGYCKSAGTLIVTGATKLYMDDMSELGPLDVQVRKGDELFARNSGLEIFEAITFLQNQTLAAFRQQARILTSQDGLSTKVSADIAARLTRGIFEPIAAQIDPIKLAEMQRANDITMAYGARLAEVGKNVHPSKLGALVGAYPSHGFVIDRKEARLIFDIVKEPLGKLLLLSALSIVNDADRINASIPVVEVSPWVFSPEDVQDESDQDQGDGCASTADGDSTIGTNSDGDRESKTANARPSHRARGNKSPATASRA